MQTQDRGMRKALHLVCLLLTVITARADDALAAALNTIAPGKTKWASVCVITNGSDGKPAFTWHDYRGTATRTDFWPASTIKLYAVIAALELLHERGHKLDTTLTFEHREKDAWHLDCARTMREMISAIFQRSSNEDYTLMLRVTGIDRINTHFLTPGRGFPRSALMRGYVKGRPWEYVREEPQRITLISTDGAKRDIIEHTWSRRSYSAERGCTVIDAQTGNLTSPRELADCMRRLMFHEHIPAPERHRISNDMLHFLRHGGAGLTGLETKHLDSGPAAWLGGADTIFPKARFYHKCGVISTHALEVAFIDDTANVGPQYILVPVINVGGKEGEKIVSEMSRAIAQWMRP